MLESSYKAGAWQVGNACMLVCCFVGEVVMFPRFTSRLLKRNFKPRDIDIIRERARHGAYEEFEGYDPTSYERMLRD